MFLSSQLRSARPRTKFVVLAVASCFAGAALANPVGPTVIHGTASFNAVGNTLNITNSPNAILNWQGFSIGANEITRFLQNSAASSVLNRVTGAGSSAILGQLLSNGRVLLINPNGVFIGGGAVIDMAGFTASSLRLSDADFLAGKYKFSDQIGAARVVNQGVIRTPEGGQVYLIAPSVENSGLITSPTGEVVLAAGKSVELIQQGTPYLRVELTAPDNAAVNVGQVLARGGSIGIYGATIRNSGTLSANSATVGESGRIVLRAKQDVTLDAGSRVEASGPAGGSVAVQAEGGTLLASGAVEAKGSQASGGDVRLLGDRVALLGTASVDASGATGGGTVLVGGDYQGRNAAIQNSRQTFIADGATLRADATGRGDGGKAVVWADDWTRYYGSASARGGALGGDGGSVEVSGKQNLTFAGTVLLDAPRGRAGSLLLDPADLYITTNAGHAGTNDTGDPFQDNGSTDFFALKSNIELVSGTVNLSASHDIIFETSLNLAQTTGLALNANAANGIQMASFGVSTGGGDVSLQAGPGGITQIGISNVGSGAFSMTSGGAVTQTGAITASTLTVSNTAGPTNLAGATNSITTLGTVNAGVQSFSLHNSGALGQSGAVTAGTFAATLDAGALSLNTQANTISNLGTITAPGGFSLTNGNTSLAVTTGITTTNAPVSIDAGTGTYTQNNVDIAAGSGAITVIANGVNLAANTGNNAFQTFSALTLKPKSAAQAMSLAGAAAFDLTAAEVTALAGGVSGSIVIGDAANANAGSTLTVGGPVSFGAKTVSLNAASIIESAATGNVITAGTLNLNATTGGIGSAAANGGIDVALSNVALNAAGNAYLASAGGINLGAGASSVGTGVLGLTAGGAVTQSAGGAVTAGTLTVTNTSGPTNLTGATNSISTLGTINAAGQTFSIANGTALAQSGALTADTLVLTNTAGASTLDQANVINKLGVINAAGQSFTLTDNVAGGLTQTGALTVNTLALTNTAGATTLTNAGNAISVLGTVNAAGQSFTLTDNVAGGLTQAGALTANTLVFTNTAGATTLTNAGNAVSKLGAMTTSGGAFSLANTVALTVDGVVNAGAQSFSVDAGANAVDFSTNATAVTAGTLSLKASDVDTLGNIGTLAATNVNLVPSTLGGTIGLAVADAATFTLDTTDIAKLKAGASNITVGGAGQTGALSLGASVDLAGRNLTLNGGQLNDATNTLLANGLTLNLSSSTGGNVVKTTVASLAANTTGGTSATNQSLTVSETDGVALGTMNLGGGTLDLTAAGAVTQSGALTADTLVLTNTAGASTLDQANAINKLGVINAAGQSFTLTDNVAGGLTQTGALTANTLTLTNTAGATTLTDAGNAINVLGTVNAAGQSFTLTDNVIGGLTQSGAMSAGTLVLTNTAGASTLSNAGNAINVLGTVNAAGQSFTLTDNVAGGLTQTGALTANTLVFTNTAGASTLTNAGNAVSKLGAMTTSGGAFSLVSTVALTVDGVVNAGAQSFSVDTGANAVDFSTNATAVTAGTLSLKASDVDTLGNIGTLAATNVNLVPSTLGGTIGLAVADAATFTLDTTDIAKLKAGASNITVGGAGQTGALSLGASVDLAGRNLTLNGGQLNDATNTLLANGLTLNLSSSTGGNVVKTTVTSLAANTTGGTSATNQSLTVSEADGVALGAMNLGGGTLDLTAAGAVTQTGALTADTLVLTNTAGASTLDQANAINKLGVINAAGQSFTLTDNVAGGLTQTGALTANTLALTNTAGATTLTDAGNAINVLGTVNAAGQSFTLTDNVIGGLTQSGAMSAGTLVLTNTAGATTLTNAGNAINVLGTVNAAGQSFTLTDNVAGGLTQTGALTANTLVFTNTAGASTLTNAGNAVSKLGAMTTSGGAFSLVSTVPLTVDGVVNAGAQSFSVDTGANAVDFSTNATAVTAGTLSLKASDVDTLGNIGTLAATNVNLVPSTLGGTIGLAVADAATFTLTTGDIAALKAGAANVTVGGAGQTGALSLGASVDLAGRNLTLNGGQLNDATNTLLANGLTLNLSSSTGGNVVKTTVASLAANTTGGTSATNQSLTVSEADGVALGAMNLGGGTLDLTAAGAVTQTGALTADTLVLTNTAGASTLDQANAINKLGVINAAGQSFTLTDNVAGGLTQTGALTATTLTLTNTTGPSTLNNASNAIGSLGAIDSTGGDLTLVNSQGLAVTANLNAGAHNLSLDTGGNALTFSGTPVVTGANLTLTASDVVGLNNANLTALSGVASLRPSDPTSTLGLAGGAGSFNLDASEIATLKASGASGVVIGATGGSGALTLGTVDLDLAGKNLTLNSGRINDSVHSLLANGLTLNLSSSTGGNVVKTTVASLAANTTGGATTADRGLTLTETDAISLGTINLNDGTFTLAAGGAIDYSTGTLTAGGLGLSSPNGIGTPAAPMLTSVSTLQANGGTGGVYITNTGALTIIGTGINAAGGIGIRTNSPLTVNSAVVDSAGGNVLLAAQGNSATDELTVNANVTASGGNGNIDLYAGSNILHTSGAVSAAGSGNINFYAGVNENNGGAKLAGYVNAFINQTGGTVAAASGNVSMRAAGNVTVLNASSTTGTVTLGADAGFADLALGIADGTGNLSLSSGAAVSSGSASANAITLSGADVAIDTSGTPATVTASGAGGGVQILSSQPSRPMMIGDGSAVAGVNLAGAELAQITTPASGRVTFGSSSQAGNITFYKAVPATTSGAAVYALQNTASGGAIILDDGAGTAAALNAGAGAVNLTAGSGGIVATAGANTTAEIASSGTVTLNTTGGIGASGNWIQFDGTTMPSSVVVGSAGGAVYLQGLGALTLGAVTTTNAALNVASAGTLTAGANLNTGASIDLNAGANPVAFAGTPAITATNLTVTGSDVTSLDNATLTAVTGTITLKPSATGSTIGLANGSTGSFNLNTNEIATLKASSAGAVVIGTAGGTGALDMGAPVDLGAKALTLNSGRINDGSNTITAGSLTLNLISTAGANAVKTTAGTLVADTSAATGSANQSLTVTDTGGVALGVVNLAGGTLNLTAAGAVTQAGALTADTLVLTNTAGATTLNNGSNAINVLGAIDATGNAFTLTDNFAGGITQTGALKAATLVLTNTAGNTTLDHASNAINALGTVNAGANAFTLVDNVAGGITQTGVLTADTLALTNTAGPTTLDQANAVAKLGAVDATGRTFTLTNTTALIQTGALKADTLVLTNTAGDTTLNHSGNAVKVLGTIDTTGRSFTLVDNVATGITQTGVLTAATLALTNTAGTTDLTGATNSITNLGTVNAAGQSFSLHNSGALGQTGIVTAGTFAATLDAGALNLATQPNAISALGVINAPGGFSLTNGNTSLTVSAGISTSGGPVSIDVGTGTFTQNDVDIAAGGAITVIADGVALAANTGNDAFQTSGVLTLKPKSAAQAMSLAGAAGFDLTATEAAALAGGVSGSIVIGDAANTNAGSTLTVGGPVSFGAKTVSLNAASIGESAATGNVITAGSLNLKATAGGIGSAGANGGIDVALSNVTLNTAGNNDAYLASAGGFNLGTGASSVGTGVLGLTAGGAVTQSAGGALTAGTLTVTNTSGATDLTGATNSVTNLGAISAAGQSFSINNSGALGQTGIVTAGTFSATLTGGALNLATQTNAISNLGAITAPGGFSLTNGNTSLTVTTGISTTNASVSIDAGTGTYAQGDADIVAGSGAITVIADGVNLAANTGNNAFQTSGVLTLKPKSAAQAMSLAGAAGFDLTATEVAALAGGVSGSIVIGDAANTNAGSTLTVGGPVSFGAKTVSLNAASIIESAATGNVITAGSLNLNATAGGIGSAGANGGIDVLVGNVTLNTAGNSDAYLASAGGFNLGTGASSVGTGVLGLTAAGAVTQSAGGALTAGTLTLTNTSGATDLLTTGATNSITNLGTVNAAGQSFSLHNSGALSQTGIVTAGTFAATLDAGALNLATQPNAISALGVINAPGGFSLTNGNTSLTVSAGISTSGGPVSIDVGTGIFTQNDVDIAAGGAITVIADGVALAANTGNDAFQTSGVLTLKPKSAAQAMSLAGAAGFDLTATEVAALAGGVSGSIVIGDAANTNAGSTLTVGGPVSFGAKTVSLNAASIGESAATGNVITAGSLNLKATAGGIGSAGANGGIDVALSNVTLNTAGNNDAYLASAGGFNLGTGASSVGTGVLGLTAGGAVTQSAGGALTAGTLTVTNTSGATDLTGATNSITNLGTVNAGGQSFSLHNSGALSQTGIVTAGTFAATLDAGALNLATQPNAISALGAITAPGGFSLTNGVALSTSTISTTNNPIDISLSGANTLLTVGGNVASAGGAITLASDNMNLASAINAGAGAVTLKPTSAATLIKIGSGVGADVPGELHLSDTEIGQITTSGLLTIGSGASAGGLTISGTTNLPASAVGVTGPVTLQQGGSGAINVNAALTSPATLLTLQTANGNIAFGQGAGVTGITGGAAVTLSSSGGAIVGDPASVADVSAGSSLVTLSAATGISLKTTIDNVTATNTASGNIAISDTAGGLTVSTGGVNQAGAGTVDITATGGTLNVNETVQSGGAGAITLAATGTTSDVVVATGKSVTSTGGNIAINADKDITLSGTGTVITSGTGTVTLTADKDGNGTGAINAANSTTAIQAGSGLVTLLAAQGITAGTTIDNVTATNTVSGNIAISDTAGGLTVSTGGVNQAGAGTVGITATGGTLNVNGTVQSSGAGAITLAATGLTSDVVVATTKSVTSTGGNIAINADQDITLSGTGTVITSGTGTITLTADKNGNGTGAINANGSTTAIQAGNGLVTLLSAQGIAAGTTIDNVTATNTVSGNIAITDTAGGLTVSTGGVNQTGGGTVGITATGGTLNVNETVQSGGAGTITLTATGLTSDVVVATGRSVTSTGGNIAVNAYRDITLTGTGSVITSGTGTVTLTADADATGTGAINANGSTTAIQAGTGLVTLLAAQGIAAGTTITNVTATNTASGNIAITDTAGGLTVSTGGVNQSGTGTVGITATGGTLNVNGTVQSSGAGAIALAATGLTSDVVVATGKSVTSTGGNIAINADQDITLSGTGTVITSGTGTVTLTADKDGNATGAINANGSTTAIQAGSGLVTLLAAQGITAGTTIDNVTATNTASGNIAISDTAGGLTVSTGGVNQAGTGTVGITTTGGTLNVNETVQSGGAGTITLAATGASSDVVVATGKSVTSTGGNIAINADRDITLTTTGTVITSGTGTVTLTADKDGNGTGAINAANSGTAIQAGSGLVTLLAAQGIAAGTTITNVTATNTASGNIAITDTAGGLNVSTGGVNQAGAGTVGITATGGTLNMNETVTSTGNGLITLNATGNASDITVAAGKSVSSSGGGSIVLNADNDITVANTGTVATGGGGNAGTITLLADATDGNSTGAIVANNAAVAITTGTGAGLVNLGAATGIGAKTAIVNLTAANTTGGNIAITDTQALNVLNVSQGGNGAVALDTTSGNMTIVASGGGGTGITSSGNGTVTLTPAATLMLANDITTAGGTVVVNRPTTLGVDAVIDTGGGGITFTGLTSTINSDATPRSLTLTAGTGSIDLQGAIGNLAPLSQLTITSASSARFGANVTTIGVQDVTAGTILTNGTQTTSNADILFAGNLVLEGNTFLTTGAGAGDIIVTGTTAAASAGGQSLELAAGTGSITLQGAVGGTPLSSLKVDSATTATFGSNVITTGFQDITAGTINTNGTHTTSSAPIDMRGNVVLTGSTTMSPGGGSTTFWGTVEGPQSLTLLSSGTTTFMGNVGSATPLASILSDAGGSTVFDQGIVRTSGSQTYGDAVIVNASTVFTGANIQFNGSLDGGVSVTVNDSGTTRFAGPVGASSPLASLTTDAAGTTTINGVPIITSGPQTYQDPVILSGATSSLTTGGGDVTFGSTVSGSTPGADGLTINAGFGNVTFSGTVGSTRVGDILIGSAGNVLGASSISSRSLTTSGVQQVQLNGPVDTTGAVSLSASGPITIASTITTSSGGAVTFGNGGTLTIGGNISADGPVAQVSGGAVALNADITTTSDSVSFAGPVALGGGPRSIDTSAGGNGADITFGNTLNGNGNDLTLNAGTAGNINFYGALSNMGALNLSNVNNLALLGGFTGTGLIQAGGGGSTTLGGVIVTTGPSGVAITTNGTITVTGQINTNNNPVNFIASDWNFDGSTINAGTQPITISQVKDGTINIGSQISTADFAALVTSQLYIGRASNPGIVNIDGSANIAATTPNVTLRATGAGGRLTQTNPDAILGSPTTLLNLDADSGIGAPGAALRLTGTNVSAANATTGDLVLEFASGDATLVGPFQNRSGAGLIDVSNLNGSITTAAPVTANGSVALTAASAGAGARLDIGQAGVSAGKGITLRSADGLTIEAGAGIHAAAGDVTLLAGNVAGMALGDLTPVKPASAPGSRTGSAVTINAPVQAAGDITILSSGPVTQSESEAAGLQAADGKNNRKLTVVTFNDAGAPIGLKNHLGSGTGICLGAAGTGNCAGTVQIETRFADGRITEYAAGDIDYWGINAILVQSLGTGADARFTSKSVTLPTSNIVAANATFWATDGDVDLEAQIANEKINKGKSGGSLNLYATGNVNVRAPRTPDAAGVTIGKRASVDADGSVTPTPFQHELKLVAGGDINITGSIYLAPDRDLNLRADASAGEVAPYSTARPAYGDGKGSVTLTVQPASYYGANGAVFPLEVEARNIVVGIKDGAKFFPVQDLRIDTTLPGLPADGAGQRGDASLSAAGDLEVYLTGDLKMTAGKAQAVTTKAGQSLTSTAVAAIEGNNVFIRGVGKSDDPSLAPNLSSVILFGGNARADNGIGGSAFAAADASIIANGTKTIYIGGDLRLQGGVTSRRLNADTTLVNLVSAQALIDPATMNITTGGNVVLVGGLGPNSTAKIVNSGDILMNIGGHGPVSFFNPLTQKTETLQTGGLVIFGGPGSGVFDSTNNMIGVLAPPVQANFTGGGGYLQLVQPDTRMGQAYIQSGPQHNYDSLLSYILYAANQETQVTRIRAGVNSKDDANLPSCN